MTEPAPRIDYANLPAPAEGIVVTMFITVRSVARSRDFYSRVLGGTVVLEENPCIVKLSNWWILMNPGGPPTPDKPGGFLNSGAESDDEARSPGDTGGRLHDRSRPGHGRAARPSRRKASGGPPWLNSVTGREIAAPALRSSTCTHPVNDSGH